MIAEDLFQATSPERSGPDYAWWNGLRHHRLLIGTAALHAAFPPDDPKPLWKRRLDEVAYALNRFEALPAAEGLNAWLEVAVHEAIGLPAEGWTKGNGLGTKWSAKVGAGESIRPRWVWNADGEDSLALFVTEGARSIGVGRGRRDHARVLDWLRAQKRDLAVVTNGRQWRIVFATETSDAWCESDISDWITDGRQGDGLTALRLLLSPEGQPKLREAIRETRRGHAELSKVLGERVRQAIELLVQGSQSSIDGLFDDPDNTIRLEHVYQAATRIAMRLVVVMFAESRQLLSSPSLTATRDAYWESYSLQKLRLTLEREALSSQTDRGATAWPRILALFRLLYQGSAHSELTRRAYGGRLFEPGDPNSSDPILRALAAFERTDACPTDAQVAKMLGLMARAPVKLRQGRAATWTELPVDFSQLDVEYVGILYEGLLDYELHRAGANEPMVFLNVGVQPVLPLARLEAMDDAALKTMVKELSKKEKSPGSDGDAEAETEEEAEEDEETVEEEVEETAPADLDAEPLVENDDAYEMARDRALAWAGRAAVAAGIVKKPKGKKADDRAQQEAVSQAARGMISRLVLPGELFLVRHGGTRKGSGTFYTKPQLAEPTVARTLEPLVYDRELPRDPETVLAVKVCDPACGSGSFLVSSLRYLTRALYESIVHHGWIVEHSDGRISWEDPENARPAWFKTALEDFRGLNERPEPLAGQSPREKVTAQLLRIIAERCVYGVDLNPLAVELCKLSLWIATMDPNLRFSFLDHKIKVGNGLVGCWFDRFQDYPVMAWQREGGDKSHSTSVHHKEGTWTKAIASYRDRIKKELIEVVGGQGNLYRPPVPPEQVHEEAVRAYERLHETAKDPDVQKAAYEAWRNSPGFVALKEAFDAWCAIWFWPVDHLDLCPTPATLHDLSPEAREIVRKLAEDGVRFLHWELEFPDVFDSPGSGFSAMVGNPPWETLQPNSKEFFSNLDPLYRTYGKQPALQRQRELFGSDANVETEWLAFCADMKSIANWATYAGSPFGDPDEGESTYSFSRSSNDTAMLHARWRKRRSQRVGYADPRHPYSLQGSGKPYTYKLFLELAHGILRPGGRMGMIVPSGVYSDRGSDALRRIFLDRCRWEWLFGFENRNGIFDIHRSFKFCPLVVQKGGRTEAVQTAFMRRNLEDWSRPERFAINVTREQVAGFSPKSMAFLEVQDERDVRVLEKMTANGIPLGHEGPDGWGVKYQQGDFNMTSDSKLFPPREKWEAKGYRPDEYGHWLLGRWVPVSEVPAAGFASPGWIKSRDGDSAIHVDDIEDVALPLYEGRMIGQFDFSQKGWVSGKGRTAVWRDIPWESKQIEPQYLMKLSHYGLDEESSCSVKFHFMDVTSATNMRTMIGATALPFPGNHKSPILYAPAKDSPALAIGAVLNAFVFDFDLRTRLGGTSVVWGTLQECIVMRRTDAGDLLDDVVLRLLAAPRFAAPVYCAKSNQEVAPQTVVCNAFTHSERLRLRCILDATVAHLYGLDRNDFRWILRDCDHLVERSTNKAFTRALDAKGFWRVDKALPPEHRHTVLAQVAFNDLQDLISRHGEDEGLRRFLGTGPDDGWMLPETLRLADYGLGHDDRAQKPQSVAPALGPRFFDWQLRQTPEEAWSETQHHAENIRRIRTNIHNGIVTPRSEVPAKQSLLEL